MLLLHPAACGSGFQRGPIGDSIKPVAEQFGAGDVSGSPGQHHERRLERILGIFVVARHAPRDGEHHRAVSADEFGERLFGAIRDEAREQVAVRRAIAAAVPKHGRDHLSGNEAGRFRGHRRALGFVRGPDNRILDGRARARRRIWSDAIASATA